MVNIAKRTLVLLQNHATSRTIAGRALHRSSSLPGLPPGELDPSLDLLEKADRGALLHRAKALGPIFKGTSQEEACVCIIGLVRCHQFLQNHATDLRVTTIELDHLIPKGFLCEMEGADHLHYRRVTARSQRHDVAALAESEASVVSIAENGLRSFHDSAARHGNSAEAYSAAASWIATAMLTRLFLGAEEGSPEFEGFLARFKELGPHGLVWNPQRRQEGAFRAFSEDLNLQVALLRNGRSSLSQNSLLGKMVEADDIDETALGNLIYQAEMGRSDLKNLFRWLTYHATDDPRVLDQIVSSCIDAPAPRPLAEAFVLETLRTDQSERLMRRATRDIVFEGFLIPRDTAIRLCLWESHQDESIIDDPARFNPDRFLASVPAADVYAPFGLDHHKCPMASMTVQLGTIFLQALAQYHVATRVEGRAVRGAYHWEPAPSFAVELTLR